MKIENTNPETIRKETPIKQTEVKIYKFLPKKDTESVFLFYFNYLLYF